MEQQAEVAQPNALPADIEAILSPISTPQAQPAVEPVVAQPVAQPAPQPVAQPTEPVVPVHVMLEERRERQALQAQVRQLLESRYQASQPQPEPIDPITNPEQAWNAVGQRIAATQQQINDMAIHSRANTSEMLARSKYGDATVETAREAAVRAGLGNHFLTQPNPYEAVLEWHRGQQAAKEVGTDPAAYREKVKAEILAELRAAASKPGQSQVLPPSLSSVTRASASVPGVQDTSDFFRSTLFAKPQRT